MKKHPSRPGVTVQKRTISFVRSSGRGKRTGSLFTAKPCEWFVFLGFSAQVYPPEIQGFLGFLQPAPSPPESGYCSPCSGSSIKFGELAMSAGRSSVFFSGKNILRGTNFYAAITIAPCSTGVGDLYQPGPGLPRRTIADNPHRRFRSRHTAVALKPEAMHARYPRLAARHLPLPPGFPPGSKLLQRAVRGDRGLMSAGSTNERGRLVCRPRSFMK